nr:GIY-YIG nuclease family protein [Bacteroides sp.]
MKEIHTILFDGTLQGPRLVYAGVNCPTHVYVIPRNRRSLISTLPDVSEAPCLYFLIGTGDDGAEEVYIGQTMDPYHRLNNHASNPWWHTALIFVSASHRFFCDDVRFLEHAAISAARHHKRMPLRNTSQPRWVSRRDYRIHELRMILDDIALFAAFLGYPVLLDPSLPEPALPVPDPIEDPVEETIEDTVEDLEDEIMEDGIIYEPEPTLAPQSHAARNTVKAVASPTVHRATGHYPRSPTPPLEIICYLCKLCDHSLSPSCLPGQHLPRPPNPLSTIVWPPP